VKLISFDELRLRYGIGYTRDHVRRLGKAKKFPQPIKLAGGRRIAFIEAEIATHVAAQIEARDAK
jgi:predicted DNA-binding transcriptional regulator AlpA